MGSFEAGPTGPHSRAFVPRQLDGDGGASLRIGGDGDRPVVSQPDPAGDGQTLNLRAQTNGRFFQSYSMSFVEPWLGGHKQNSLSLSLFHSVQTNGKDK